MTLFLFVGCLIASLCLGTLGFVYGLVGMYSSSAIALFVSAACAAVAIVTGARS